MPHYKEGWKSRWFEEDTMLKNLTKINQKGHTSTTLLTIEPCESLKFWSPIRSSDIGRSSTKIRSSGPLSEVLIFVVMVRFELDIYILIPSQSNHWPLSVFHDRQLATGIPKAMFEGLRRMQNSEVTQRDERFILVWYLFWITAFMSSRCVAFCVGLVVWLCVQGGAPCLSLYRKRGQGMKLVLAGYN
jgi:hypothetical protein